MKQSTLLSKNHRVGVICNNGDDNYITIMIMIYFINYDYNYDDKLSLSIHITIICHDFFITLTFSFRD